MKPILVLVAPGFEEIELCAPVDILRRLEIPVVLVGVQGLLVEGAHGMMMQADMLLVDVDADLYDAVVLPGGQASWLLRDTPAVLDLVEVMHEKKKLIAAICAAPIALEAAGVLAKRKVCCYPAEAVVSELKSVDAICDTPTCRDGHIITGRGPGAALEFGFAIGAYYCPQERVDAQRAEMCAV